MKFPPGFLFGLANADHQVESYDPKYPDVWDLWEETQNKTKRGNACRFEEKYPEDIKLAADLGTKVFRFAVSWAKVQTGPGQWNKEALAHYRKLAQCIHDHDMKVMVTLSHFTWPLWLEKDHNGLIGEDFPETFRDYAEQLALHMGDLVDYWISFNEPTQLVHGYIKTWWQEHYYMPPGMPLGTNPSGQAEAVGKLIYNLFSAHAKAREVIKKQNPEGKVGINPLVTGFPPWLQYLLDHQFHSSWLLSAVYKFNCSRPLVIEKTEVDFMMGGVTPKREEPLLYSQPYIDSENATQHIALPAGGNGLLAIINAAIASSTGKIRVDATATQKQPISLADYFRAQDGSTPNTALTDEVIKRIKRRKTLTVGLRAQACTLDGDCGKKFKPLGEEKYIIEIVAKQIFGNAKYTIEYVKLAPSAPPKALKTRVSLLNKIWHFMGASGLIANANWWYLGSKGQLPPELCPPEAIGAHDFIGFDYYWGLPTKRLHQFSSLLDAAEGRFLTAPVWPAGLKHALKKFHSWFPDQEILIIENGCVPLADGIRRQDYLNLHLREIADACAEGVPVKGYLLWSLTSNREWGHAFDHNTDFGLYRVDLDTDPELKRIPSKEVQYYKELIRSSMPTEPPTNLNNP